RTTDGSRSRDGGATRSDRAQIASRRCLYREDTTQGLAGSDFTWLDAVRRQAADPQVLDLQAGHLFQGLRSAILLRTQGRQIALLGKWHGFRGHGFESRRPTGTQEKGNAQHSATAPSR